MSEAQHPYQLLSHKKQERLLASSDPDVLRQLWLVCGHREKILLGLAANPALPKDILETLFNNYSYLEKVAEAIAGNPSIDQDWATYLSEAESHAFATNPTLPLWKLEDPNRFALLVQHHIQAGTHYPLFDNFPALAHALVGNEPTTLSFKKLRACVNKHHRESSDTFIIQMPLWISFYPFQVARSYKPSFGAAVFTTDDWVLSGIRTLFYKNHWATEYDLPRSINSADDLEEIADDNFDKFWKETNGS